MGKDGVVIQLHSREDHGELTLGWPAVQGPRGGERDSPADDDAVEAEELVQDFKLAGPVSQDLVHVGLGDTHGEWWNAHLVPVGVAKDSQEALKARPGDRAALEEPDGPGLAGLEVMLGEVPESSADALESRPADVADVEDEGIALLDPGLNRLIGIVQDGLAVREADAQASEALGHAAVGAPGQWHRLG